MIFVFFVIRCKNNMNKTGWNVILTTSNSEVEKMSVSYYQVFGIRLQFLFAITNCMEWVFVCCLLRTWWRRMCWIRSRSSVICLRISAYRGNESKSLFPYYNYDNVDFRNSAVRRRQDFHWDSRYQKHPMLEPI